MASEFPQYTDQQRTRVVAQGSIYTRPRENASIGSTQPIMKQEGLFAGISVPQVLASAAAAATSMLLASKIGIAGSVIGAAVSSAVTIVATQLYRRALTAGARKLHDVSAGAVDRSAQATTALPGNQNPYLSASSRGARIAPTKLQARAAAQRAATQRKIAIASALVAALTLALVTATIMVGTAGEGLGTKPAPLLSRSEPALDADAAVPKEEPVAEPGTVPQPVPGADADSNGDAAVDTPGAPRPDSDATTGTDGSDSEAGAAAPGPGSTDAVPPADGAAGTPQESTTEQPNNGVSN